MARPTKPYFASWLDKHITGLCRLPDKRRRIVATGERYREPDERKAVEIYWAKTGQQPGSQVFVGETLGRHAAGQEPQWDYDALGRSVAEQRATQIRFAWTSDGQNLSAGVWVPEELLWRWFTEQLATRRAYVAKRQASLPWRP